MNHFLKRFAIFAAVALFTIASAGAASAGDHGYGKHYGGHSYGHGHGYSYGRGHDHRRLDYGGYRRNDYRRNTFAFVIRKPCHATYKYGYAHGRRAKIGGTMCYDGYGNAFIVAGSRFVIAYY